MGTLTDVSTLNARMASGQRTVLLDVRWALGDPDGRAHYLREHIPGAVYVDLPTELAEPAEPARGRHPLPPAEKLQEAARRWGVREGDTVVAYDDAGGTSAARLWWMLRNAGFGTVYLLDGGLPAWRRAGLPLKSGPEQAAPGDVTLTGGGMPVIDAAEAAEWAARGVLLDARAGERYRGEIEPVDPRAGHIPPPGTLTTAAASFRPMNSGSASRALESTQRRRRRCTAAAALRPPMRSRHWKSRASPRRSSPDPSQSGPTMRPGRWRRVRSPGDRAARHSAERSGRQRPGWPWSGCAG
jgi:thiosulfate/3-mercaptopyruvate sulfurtransferase